MRSQNLNFKVKCCNTTCQYVFRINDIVYPIINDIGYAIYECPLCHAITRIKVWNVDVHQNNRDCVDVYEDGNENRKLSLANIPLGERNDDCEKHEYSVKKCTIWKHNGVNYEEIAIDCLKNLENDINVRLDGIRNACLAGQFYARSIEKLLFKVWVNDEQYVLLQKDVTHDDFSLKNILPIGVSNVSICEVIDGVFPRDKCFAMLNFLLMRWNMLCQQVIFASPYIGFVQNTSKYNEQIHNFWEWLGATLDMHKTLFITKKATFTRFKMAMEELGIDYQQEKKWDSLTQLVKAADEYDGRKRESAKSPVQFYQHFHAKFYAGVFDDHVEVLVGSYNIHQGLTLENLILKIYRTDEFREMYLKPFSKDLPEQNYNNSYFQVGLLDVKDGAVKCKTLEKSDYLREIQLVLSVDEMLDKEKLD